MERQEQPKSIEDIRAKFEQWRLSRKNHRERIHTRYGYGSLPLSLTKDHSVSAAAKALRLNGQNVKKQVVIYPRLFLT